MKVIIFKEAEAAQEYTAGLLAKQVTIKSDAVLGLATGETMLSVYRLLANWNQKGLSFRNVSTFNLDEYIGLASEDPRSYHHYMQEMFFNLVDIDRSNTCLPKGDAVDPEAEATRFELAIRQAGGIDLQLLGIGENGHIGFNEPFSSFSSRTRVTTLSDETRKANSRFFAMGQTVPHLAITMGIGTILESRTCVLLATGKQKATAIAAMAEGPIDPVCPASALQLHQDAIVVLDAPAAAELSGPDCERTNHVNFINTFQECREYLSPLRG